MAITVRFFASFADQVGMREATLASANIATAKDAWAACALDMEIPDNVRVAINQEYADTDTPVKDQDEVAFFPPVTGG